MMNTVYLIAMIEEIEGLFDIAQFSKVQEHGFSIFKHPTQEFVIVETGIGKSNAAAAAQYVLQNYPANKYINAGLVGAFNRSLQLGQVLRVKKCQFFDVDATAFNYKLGQLPGCELAEYQLVPEGFTESEPTLISLVSGDTFLHEPALRQTIQAHFQPDAVDMELASIAHVFHRHQKLPLLSSVKVVSDYADQSSDVDFDQQMKKSLENLKSHLATF